MEYLPLIKECKEAIEQGRCLGCIALENPYFMGNKNCEHNKKPTVKESIDKIHKILEI